MARSNLVVPAAVKLVSSEMDLGEILIGDLDASGIGFRVQFSMDFETGCGSGRRDETDNRLKAS